VTEALTAVGVIITALASLAATAIGMLTVFKVIIPNYRLTQETKVIAEETHVIVNSEKTNRDAFNADLIEALKQAGVTVPVDQSLPSEGES
jgi:dolichyl-phosphate-mannose--protein O-mannosyl transferase